MKQINETLYGLATDGSIQEWKVFVDGNKVVVEWGQIDGKKQTKETVCEAKNVGRSNETTPEEQAELEAVSKWMKKRDRSQYRTDPNDLDATIVPYPMLAHDATKHEKKITYPCDIQPKLDGVRMMVFRERDTIRTISRKGVDFELHEDLFYEIAEIMENNPEIEYLDGELYHHDLSLQEIVGAAKSTTNKNHNKLEYWIFDVPSDKKWRSRFYDLATMIADTVNMNHVTLINTSVDVQDFNELHMHLERFIVNGYEGAIIRSLDGDYKFGKRNHGLLKLKKFKDSEARIFDVVKDKNNEGVLRCKWVNESKEEVHFECKMVGTHEFRSYDNMRGLLGRWINFTYQQETNDGIPQFPVGQYVREVDEAGNPLI